jgi:hypothetical protein
MADKPEKWLERIRTRNRLLGMMPWLGRVSEWRQLLRAGKRWRTEGYFAPVPFFIRRAQLLQVGKRIGAEVAVETGTYRGDTTAFLARHFRETHTIEVVPALAALARERFQGRPGIKVWDGDSSDVLRSLLPQLKGTVLFYLDGHDSGGITGKGLKACPVREELEIIFGSLSSRKMTVVIDDARLFGADPDYPTIADVRQWMQELCPGATVRLEHDAIIIGDEP